MAESSSTKIWYPASCHCGEIAYRALLEPLGSESQSLAIKCTCSICTKNGYVLVYPSYDEVQFEKGYDKLKRYTFATKTRDHIFCPECGSSIGIDFYNGNGPAGSGYGLNTRMFKDVDLDVLKLKHYDGRAKLNAEYNN